MNSAVDRVYAIAELLAADPPPAQRAAERGYLQISITHQGQLEMRGTRGYVEWLLFELTQRGWSLEMDNLRWCG